MLSLAVIMSIMLSVNETLYDINERLKQCST